MQNNFRLGSAQRLKGLDQTFLLVDDCENDTLLMREAFRKAGFKVGLREVHNGAEAIEYLSGSGVYADRVMHPLPSVVLMDLNMPHKNGFELLAWTRGREALAGVAFIIMTASMRPEDISKAYELGAASYLVKPVELKELIAMVACLQQWTCMNQFPPQSRSVAVI